MLPRQVGVLSGSLLIASATKFPDILAVAEFPVSPALRISEDFLVGSGAYIKEAFVTTFFVHFLA